jgi:hypothetical protein
MIIMIFMIIGFFCQQKRVLATSPFGGGPKGYQKKDPERRKATFSAPADYLLLSLAREWIPGIFSDESIVVMQRRYKTRLVFPCTERRDRRNSIGPCSSYRFPPQKIKGLLPIEWVISVDFPSPGMLFAKAKEDSGGAQGAHPAPGGT